MENSKITNSNFLAENYCEICDHQSSRTSDFKKHIQSMKHIKNAEENEKRTRKRNKQQYVCESCDYTTDRKCNYATHIKSKKHMDAVNSTTNSKLECHHCNKLYSGTNNLWKHMKVCKEIRKEEEDEEEEEEETPQSDKATGKLQMREMFYEFMKVIQNSDEVKTLLIKQNEELKKQLATTNTLTNTNTNNTNSNNSNNTNSNNNQFNLQFFLNEQCKDALNIMDFVNSLDIQVSDLEETGKLGFIGGITRIFANGLKELDICKRPIHCTDLKRETLYVKSDDTWEKEEDGNPRLKKAVTRVSNLNFKQLKKWQELNPGYDIVDTAKNDEFIHLSTQAIGSCSTQETDRNIDKIMKNLCKQVVLDKKEGALRVM